MKIKRIDHNRNVNQGVDRVEIQIGVILFTLTEVFGELCINSHLDSIAVKPGCANEIKIFAFDS